MRSTHQPCLLVALPLLALIVGVTPALAGQVQLAWNAPTTNTDGTPATNLAGYHLYAWQGSGGTPQSVDVGNQTTYTLTSLVDGATYTFAVTAYNTVGIESSDSQPITVTITSPPVAVADTATTPAGTLVPIAVLANDSDPNGSPLTITAVTQGVSGTVTTDGTTVTYAPAAAFVGLDSFTYTVTDGLGLSATASVTVTVTTVTLPPVAASYSVSTPVGTPLAIAVLTQDTDPNGYPLTLTGVTQGANGTVTISGSTVTYTPTATFVGTDHFTYTISDGHGGSATATVTVTVFVLVQLQAEAGTLYSPMTVGTDTIDPTLQYVWVPSSYTSILDPLQTGGYAQYSFSVPQADGYVIWGHVSPSQTGTGSLFIGVDEPPGNGLITKVSPTTYQVATVHTGSTYYIDSASTITSLPPGFDGLGILKTANGNKGNKNASFLTFTLFQDATLYVAYDAKVSTFPTWLTASFTNTGQLMQTTYHPMLLWKKNVLAGPIMLPGNQYQESVKVPSMYVVLLAFQGPPPYLVWDVTPPPASTPPPPWTWDEAANNTTPVFFLGAGNHTLILRQRESGTKLDQLLITNNFSLTPQN